MRTDFHNLRNGDLIRLYPRPDNPKNRVPILVKYDRGDYYYEDALVYFNWNVEQYNQGFLLVEIPGQGATP